MSCVSPADWSLVPVEFLNEEARLVIDFEDLGHDGDKMSRNFLSQLTSR